MQGHAGRTGTVAGRYPDAPIYNIRVLESMDQNRKCTAADLPKGDTGI